MKKPGNCKRKYTKSLKSVKFVKSIKLNNSSLRDTRQSSTNSSKNKYFQETGENERVWERKLSEQYESRADEEQSYVCEFFLSQNFWYFWLQKYINIFHFLKVLSQKSVHKRRNPSEEGPLWRIPIPQLRKTEG